MRMFTFSDAKSHKFWNIDLQGTSFTVVYGKIGTAGQNSTKEFATVEKAQKEYEKLIREKLSKGYVEITPSATRSPRELLESAIISDPHDRTAHAAYADLLAEANDPRGEFMQIQLRLEDESVELAERESLKKREAELLAEHERTWLGKLAPLIIDKEGMPDWQKSNAHYTPRHRFEQGLLREIVIPDFGVRDARALIQATEETRFLRHLSIGETRYEEPDTDYEPGPDLPEEATDDAGLHILAKWQNFAGIRVFQLGEDAEDDYPNCHTRGELAHHLVKQMPMVEELRILAHRVDNNKLFALPLPNLRFLKVYHSYAYPLKKLAENPSLTRLEELYFHPHAVDEELPYGLSELRAVVNSPYLKRLTHLQMRLSIMGDAAIEVLIESGILKQMKLLDLAYGTVGDAGAEMLAACPEAKNLQFLNLRSNELTDRGITALKSLGIQIDVNEQHASTEGLDPEDILGMEFLFSGDIE